MNYQEVLAPLINNAGHVAFFGHLTGSGVDSTSDFGIFTETGGELNLIAREGSPAPDVGSDVYFGDLLYTLGNIILNDAGQIAFVCDLSGPGVDDTNDQAIFATDMGGNLHLIARTGDLFDVDPDPLVSQPRLISYLSLATPSGGGDGRPHSFNNSGRLAFRLQFSDESTGIFVATIAVPEPASLGLIAFGALALLRRQRQ
jgi:hypothetical protein